LAHLTCGQHERLDRRRGGLDCVSLLAEQLRGQRSRQHLAVGEGLCPGDVVDVPVAEQDGDPRGVEPFADPSRSIDRQMGVVDQRLAPVHDRVAGDSQHQRVVVQPIRLIMLALTIAPVVEGEDAHGRSQEPHQKILISRART